MGWSFSTYGRFSLAKKTWDRSEGIKKMIGEDQRDGNKNDE